MISETVRFKCPCCRHFLVDEEYYDACEEIRVQANQIAKQIVQEHIVELEIGYLRDIKRKSERADGRVREYRATNSEDEE